jgi:uncharacterized protein DUF2752
MHVQRLGLAGGLAALWGVAVLPAALGWQRCTLATLLHVPCPGCGMTRAIALIAEGRIGASFRMNALAVPVLAAILALAVATVARAYRVGTPFDVHTTRFGRAAIAGAMVAYGAAVVLWGLRWLGWFGGPVAVG